MTTADLGRRPEVVARATARSGAQVVMGTGFCDASAPGLGDRRLDLDLLVRAWLRDIIDGVPVAPAGGRGRPVYSGVIKAGTRGADVVTPAERRLFSAVAQVALTTGVPVLTHCAGGRLGHEQLDLLEAAGLDPARVCLGHLDHHPDPTYLDGLAGGEPG
jgi:phosphotriesterase-related protein